MKAFAEGQKISLFRAGRLVVIGTLEGGKARGQTDEGVMGIFYLH